MAINYSTCPCCESSRIKQLLHRGAFPAILFPIEKENKCFVRESPLTVVSCVDCEHMFLNHIDPEFNRQLYLDYYYLYPFSSLESMLGPYRIPFEKLFGFFISNNMIGNRLLEIGCSNIQELDFYNAFGLSCLGVSPGANSDTPDLLVDCFYEDYQVDRPYDVIVSRFNLEHIVDLNQFMKKVLKDLRPGGYLFIQVPNIRSFVLNSCINVFAHEHPHYFCKTSLISLLSRFDLSIEYAKGNDDDPSILIVAKKHVPTIDISRKVLVNLRYIDDIVHIIEANPRADIYFYGAGLSLTGILYLDDRTRAYCDRIHVIDDNNSLLGKWMPNVDVIIETQPSFNDSKGNILFITLSSIYHSEIIDRIRSENYHEIYLLDKKGVHKLEHDTIVNRS